MQSGKNAHGSSCGLNNGSAGAISRWGIVVLNARSAVHFCSEFAREYFETFFAAERPFIGGLPLTVENWVRREIAVFGTVELAVRPPQSLTVWRGEKNLQIRLATTRDQTMHILFLRAQDPTSELAKLSSLALGARATKVGLVAGYGRY